MKKLTLLCLSLFTFTLNSFSQTYQEDFEGFALGRDLTQDGFVLNQNANYTGSVTLVVENEAGNQHATLNSSTNGYANMQLSKTITVSPRTAYVFSVRTMGIFKRQLRILSVANNSELASAPEFTPTEAQEQQWIVQTLAFTTGEDDTQVKLNIYHNWSGTLKVDDIEVTTGEPRNYYLSSSLGDDDNDGSIDKPWATLGKMTDTGLIAGDSVFFKKGDRFEGHLVVNGSGKADEPIVFTAYGDGDKPVITGQVGAARGGDYQEAILVQNQSYITFIGLEVHNERLLSRQGVNDEDAYGIFVYNSGNTVMRGFTFRDMVFKKVYAPKAVLRDEGESAFNKLDVAAVSFLSTKNTIAGQEKNIRDVLIEDCYFTDIQRFGVHMRHAGGSTGVGNEMTNRNMDLVFRNNEFFHTGGTCILPTNTYNCLIEDNIFRHSGSDLDDRMPNRGSTVWTWRCYNTVIQRNLCISARGYLDSHGIHIDHENHNTFVQYNYMEDCEGGFVEILGGNVNAVYRFNISVNDGWRNNPDWPSSNHSLWINENGPGGATEYCDGSYIYNNTVYMDKMYTTAIDMVGKNTYIYNNIFYAANGANIGGKQVNIQPQGTDFFVSNNLYYGQVDNRFRSRDSNPLRADPKFEDGGISSSDGYQLKNDSEAVDAGLARQGPPVPGAGTGIFVDVPEYATVDFFGNPVDLSSGTPNIGAFNGKGQSGTLSAGIRSGKQFSVYPNPCSSEIKIDLKAFSGNELSVSLYDMNGKLHQAQKIRAVDSYLFRISSEIKNGMYTLEVKDEKKRSTQQIIILM